MLAPSYNGLQKILNLVFNSLEELCLKINVKKCSYLIFHKKKFNCESNYIDINGERINRVTECKYLGTIQNECLKIESDVMRVVNSFFAQFYSFYSKFNFVNLNILSFLFKSYATSFYGIELWYQFLGNKNVMRKCAVAYHTAIKRLCGLNKWASSHETCALANQQVFSHFIVQRTFNYYTALVNSKSPCIRNFKYFFKFQ